LQLRTLADDNPAVSETLSGHEEIADSAHIANTTDRFQNLAAEWRAATARLSSSSKIAQHPAYQQIIQLGRDAVPMILRELERDPAHWFAALRAITGEDPVSPADRGFVDRMAAAWVRWGKDDGLQ